MFSWFRRNKDEIATNGIVTNRDDFDSVPNEIIKNIISYLPFRDRTRLAQANKNIRVLVESSPADHESHYPVYEIIMGQWKKKGATYSEINRILNQRIPKEKRLKELENSSIKLIHDRLQDWERNRGTGFKDVAKREFVHLSLVFGIELLAADFLVLSLTSTFDKTLAKYGLDRDLTAFPMVTSGAAVLGCMHILSVFFFDRAVAENKVEASKLRDELTWLPMILPKP